VGIERLTALVEVAGILQPFADLSEANDALPTHHLALGVPFNARIWPKLECIVLDSRLMVP
jgi:hypothetical protein